jgi:SSS family solute:Na+ symporter
VSSETRFRSFSTFLRSKPAAIATALGFGVLFFVLPNQAVWIVVVYSLAMLWTAWFVSDKSQDVEGYTLGGRSIPGWAIGISVFGTFLSSITFLALPANTYKGNWNPFVFSLALPFAAAAATLWFIPLYRKRVSLSAYELLEQRFGYWARVYGVISYVVLQVLRIGTVQLLLALAVAPLLDWEIIPTIVFLGGIVIVYDTLGGFQAVVWTDVVQVIVLVVGAIWCLTALIGGFSGGGGEFYETLLSDQFSHKMSLGAWASSDLSQGTILVVFLYGLTENLRNYGVDQNYVQRILASRSIGEATRSLWLTAVGYLPVSLVFCLIGTALFVRGSVEPDFLPTGLAHDQVFPYFIQNHLPPRVGGLVVAAIAAAAMSTIDSCLNSSSTVIFVDLVRRLRSGPGKLKDIWILRGTTLFLGGLSTGLSVLLVELLTAERTRTIMDVWWQYAGAAGGGLFGLFLLAWLLPRTPRWVAAVAVVVSVPVMVWGNVARNISPDSPWKPFECPLHPNLVGIAGTAALFAVGGVGWLFWRRSNSPDSGPSLDGRKGNPEPESAKS